ncbi:MAG: FAD-dependent oxidoreductase [Pseudomonadota bacterium]
MSQPDVLIVGGGPAGLAAACRLKALGVTDVRVVDREEALGGVPRHCGHYPFGVREFGRLMKGPAYARRLVDQADANGVTLCPKTAVVAVNEGGAVTLASDRGVERVTPKRLLLATGVRETPRSARLVGGARPQGVFTTGALQSLVYLHRMRPFRRPVIVGTELVSFSAILTCRHAGIVPQAMIEEGPRPVAFAAAAGLPALLRIPLLTSTRVSRVLGLRSVEGVEVMGEDGAVRTLEADGVLFTGRFVPEATLVRGSPLLLDPLTGGPFVDQHGRTSDPAVFAAGNLLRPVETAGWSFREGRSVGDAIALSLKGRLPDGRGVAVTVAGDALAYAMPQRLTAGKAALRTLQLRVSRSVKGTVRLTQGEGVLAERQVSARPEQRVLFIVPMAKVDLDGPPLRVTVEEGGSAG